MLRSCDESFSFLARELRRDVKVFTIRFSLNFSSHRRGNTGLYHVVCVSNRMQHKITLCRIFCKCLEVLGTLDEPEEQTEEKWSDYLKENAKQAFVPNGVQTWEHRLMMLRLRRQQCQARQEGFASHMVAFSADIGGMTLDIVGSCCAGAVAYTVRTSWYFL